jgi:hypothetical protein
MIHPVIRLRIFLQNRVLTRAIKEPMVVLLVMQLMLVPVQAFSQKENADTISKPVGGLWGSVILDYFYKTHADLKERGNYQYSGLPATTNALQFRRVFLGYDFRPEKKFSVEFLLAAEENIQVTRTGGFTPGAAGDRLTGYKFSPYIKYANVRWKDIWRGTDLVLGMMSTPLIRVVSAPAWGNRAIEKTMADLNKYPTTDLGISLQGMLDPLTGKTGFDLMAGTGTNGKPGTFNSGNFYGDIWVKSLNKKLWFDLYGEYHTTVNGGNSPGSQRSGMVLKIAVAYIGTGVTIGAEGLLDFEKNGIKAVRQIPGGTDTTFQNSNAGGISLYAHGPVIRNLLGFFVRMDHFNPDTYYHPQIYTSYFGTAGGPADPNTVSDFFTCGLDCTPVKSFHIEPNIWFVRFTARQQDLTGKAARDFDLVWRLTCSFSFGAKKNPG